MQPTRNLDEKITYYFGAGASANAIPMVSQIHRRIEDFQTFLKSTQEHINSKLFVNINVLEFEELFSFCNEWIPKVKIAPSIDTLAKRLYDKGLFPQYTEYKAFLVILLNYFHYISEKDDHVTRKKIIEYSCELEGRYENLFRSINQLVISSMPGNSIIPENFQFISWNYDAQLEMTLKVDNADDLPSIISDNKNGFFQKNIINLNGTSILEDCIITNRVGQQSLIKLLLRIKKNLITDFEEENIPLKFAWESEKNVDQKLTDLAQETKYVVVIGYSFPTFNRDIDNAFFHNLKPGTKVFTQGYDYADSVRIEKYLRQTFIDEKPRFKITPVESPFFYVPAEYFLKKNDYSNIVA